MLCHSFCEVRRESCIGRKKKGWKFGEGEGRENKMNTFNTCKVKKKKIISHIGEEPYCLAFLSGRNKGIIILSERQKKALTYI